MLVIKGKAGKSLKLQEMIRNRKEKILIIDTVGTYYSLSGGDNLFVLPTSLEMLWCSNIINDYLKGIRRFDIIIFNTNDNQEMIDSYKELEDLIGKECFVTIQNNNIEDIQVYEV